jgi:hypothetical protein
MLYFNQNNATVRHLMTQSSSNGQRPSHRMPKNSLFYDRVVPILLVGMAIVMAALILLAAGVLLGFISF